MLEALKRYRWPLLLSVLVQVALLLHVVGIWHSEPLTRLEYQLYDMRLNLTRQDKVDPRIVILDIDEKSLAEVGRWPWSRHRLAELMDVLFQHYHIKLVGFDVVFAEPDHSSGLPALQQLAKGTLANNPDYQAALQQLTPTLDYDARFARSLSGRPTVLGYYLSGDSEQQSGQLPPPVMDAGQLPPSNLQGAQQAIGFGANLPILQKAARSAGHFNPIPDLDGVTRRVAMLSGFNGHYYEPLSLAMYRSLNGQPPVLLEKPAGVGSDNYAAIDYLRVGDARIPIDTELAARVPYRGPAGSFPYLSISDVLAKRVPLSALQGRIVLVGTTAPGLMDLRSTPFSAVYPGVEVHANLLAGMLDNRFPAHPTYLLGAEVLLLLILGIVLLLILIRAKPLKAALTCLLAVLLVLGGNLWLWRQEYVDMPLAASLALITAFFIIHMTYGYFFESRSKRQLAGVFGQYVPPELVEKMSADPEKYTMEGDSRELTVLFSDVQGFTSIAEQLDPQQLTSLINEFLTELSTVIRQQHLGTIDKYMGDCIMAFWGAPVADPDHARSAILSALDMQKVMRQLAPRFAERGLPELVIGIGINSGRMTVGDMGSQYRKAYTVMGDAVNTAARLESLTRLYGVDIIVGELTRNATRKEFLYRELDHVRVKGKDEPVTIYQPVCLASEASTEQTRAVQLFQQALRHYREQNWDMAELQLLSLQQAEPNSTLYALFLQRIAHYRKQPPAPDWDGVSQMDSK